MDKSDHTNCCVYGCKSRRKNDNNIHFHKFPAPKAETVKLINHFGIVENIDRRKAWSIKLKMGKPVGTAMRVCSNHFTTDDYIFRGVNRVNPKLKRTAIPSVNLPVSSIPLPRPENATRMDRYLKIQEKRKNKVTKTQQKSKVPETTTSNTNLELDGSTLGHSADEDESDEYRRDTSPEVSLNKSGVKRTYTYRVSREKKMQPSTSSCNPSKKSKKNLYRENLCRTCLIPDATVDIHSTQIGNNFLIDVLLEMAPINKQKSFKFKLICKKCYVKITSFVYFREQILNSDKKLENIDLLSSEKENDMINNSCSQQSDEMFAKFSANYLECEKITIKTEEVMEDDSDPGEEYQNEDIKSNEIVIEEHDIINKYRNYISSEDLMTESTSIDTISSENCNLPESSENNEVKPEIKHEIQKHDYDQPNISSNNGKRSAEISQELQENLRRIPENISKPESSNNKEEYKQVLKLLTNVADVNNIILNEIKLLKFKYENLALSQHNPNKDEWPTSLPFKSEEDFQSGESNLPEKSKALVSLLSLVGGSSSRHSITLMLKKLLVKELALQYSGQGKKGKKSFSNTKFFNVILEASRIRNPSETDTYISQLISLSLASAGDWDGGNLRKKKIEESNVDTNQTVLQE